MVVRFTIENFMSFREKQVFYMIPGKGSLKAGNTGKGLIILIFPILQSKK